MTQKETASHRDRLARDKKVRSLTKASYVALAEFRFTLRKFLAFSEHAALVAGLTPQQHQVLLAIKGAPGKDWLSVSEIAALLLVRHHTAVELVNRLTELGFVVRKPDPDDRRRVQVTLLKAGGDALKELTSIHFEELQSIRPTLRLLLSQFEAEGVAPRPGDGR